MIGAPRHARTSSAYPRPRFYDVRVTFQAYLDNIHAKTGLWPEDFLAAGRASGLVTFDVKVGDLVAWLKSDYELGHGHAMAVVQAFRTMGAIAPAPQR